MKIFILAFLSFLFFACKKNEITFNPGILPDSIHAQYFIKNHLYIYDPGNNFNAKSKFEYYNSKIIKRSGAHLSSPYIPIGDYTDKIYDSVIYSNNKIWLFSFNKLFNPYPQPKKWEIELEGNKMTRRVNLLYHPTGDIPQDTVLFFYDSNNRIKKIERHNSVPPDSYVYIRNFEFENDNLVKISGTYIHKPNTIRSTTEELFSMYDNAPNPLKNSNFFLWDDLYYRTLSKNNFAKYSFVRYDTSNNIMESWLTIIPFFYDEKGNVRYN